MEKNRRVLKAEREWRQLIAEYLIAHFREELPGLVSVTRVEANSNLRSAKVFVSVLEFDGKVDVISLLERRRSELQKHIGNELRMKFCPQLSFILDQGFERQLKVENILKELHGQGQ